MLSPSTALRTCLSKHRVGFFSILLVQVVLEPARGAELLRLLEAAALELADPFAADAEAGTDLRRIRNGRPSRPARPAIHSRSACGVAVREV